MQKRLFWLLLWGAAFGYMEAAVVVYLRELYYPEGFAFPLKLLSGRIMWTEIGREAATLIIMAATAALAYKRAQSRVAAFAVLFGVWDIGYYLFLKLLLGWPQSLLTWDILFLIPAPWAGPVWAPLLVSALLVAAGSAVLARNHAGQYGAFGKAFALRELLAGSLIVASFLLPGAEAAGMRAPHAFAWPLFAAGLLAGAIAFLYAFRRSRTAA